MLGENKHSYFKQVQDLQKRLDEATIELKKSTEQIEILRKEVSYARDERDQYIRKFKLEKLEYEREKSNLTTILQNTIADIAIGDYSTVSSGFLINSKGYYEPIIPNSLVNPIEELRKWVNEKLIFFGKIFNTSDIELILTPDGSLIDEIRFKVVRTSKDT